MHTHYQDCPCNNQIPCTDAELFISDFQNAQNKDKTGHFRDDSIYHKPKQGTLASEPIINKKMVSSPEPLASSKSESLETPALPEFEPLPPPALNNVQVEEDDSLLSHTSASDDEKPATLNKAQPFEVPVMESDIVYRVRGIPTNYSDDQLRTLLASRLELDLSFIDIRSLATKPGRKTQTAVVVLTSIPSLLSVKDKEDEWVFKWRIVETNHTSHISFDTHFNGLTVLYTPPGNTKHEVE
jgi:hypothetical protein